MSSKSVEVSERIPLLGAAPPDEVVMWWCGTPVTRRVLLRDARRLADGLPDRTQVVNTCTDRYRFLVGLLAALMQGQVTLLPSERNPRSLRALIERYPDVYCLADPGAERTFSVTIDVAPDASRLPATGPFDVPAVPGEQPAVIVFTSGSTGQPVPHAKSWRTLVAAAPLCAPMLQLAPGARGAIVATVPPGHMYGLETSILVPLLTGASVHAGNPSLPADIEAALRGVPEPRVLVTTPVHLRALVAARRTLPRLAAVVSATSPLSAELARQAEDQSGAPVFEIYGFSEAGTVASRRTVAGAEWSAGDGMSLRRVGEACFVEASHLPSRVPLDDDIELLSDRRFILRGRQADLVKVAGHRASLAGLNAILNEIDGVLDGTFFIPADGGGGRVTRPLVFVVAPERSAEDIRRALRERVDPSFLPRRVFRVPALPRNDTGKLPREVLAELARTFTEGRRMA